MGPAEGDLDVLPPVVGFPHGHRADAAELPGGADECVEAAQGRGDPGDDPFEGRAVADVAR